MDTRQIRLALGKGMETRLAAMLVQVASQYESSVHIETANHNVNAKSIMGMMSLVLKTGDTITVTADGTDESKALDGIEDYLTGGK
ncbi:MAG: HPr family phosphocarrier protein [Clostridium sp.]|nr:HPr family phosphocarrier protein [Clostridium sp.]MBQ5420646.1 HPr family phosphocarrier protein [Clostridium sp.]